MATISDNTGLEVAQVRCRSTLGMLQLALARDKDSSLALLL